MALGKIIDAPIPSEDDCMDIFNLLDMNGDELIDKKELRVLLDKFFDLIINSNITLYVSHEWLIENTPLEDLQQSLKKKN